MKQAIIVTVLLLMAVTVFADDPIKIGFKAYSSATQVQCAILGMKRVLSGGFQGFAPIQSYSRTYTIGTKGYANYSTLNRGAISFTCRQTGTNNLIAVKVQVGGFLNGIETHFLTLDRSELITQ